MEKREMSMGALGDPSTILVRKFRWTLKTEGFNEFFTQKVKFDFSNRLIYLETIEVLLKGNYEELEKYNNWLDNPKGKIIFTTYTGCGDPIYELTFSNLGLITSESGEFDYSVSDISVRKTMLSYIEMKREYGPKKPKLSDKLMERLSKIPDVLNFNYLNGKISLSGK